MATTLTRRLSDVRSMSDKEFVEWIRQVADDRAEHADEKGIRTYLVNDALDAAGAVGDKLGEIVDAYTSYRDAADEAERAEARAREMADRVARKKAELARG